MIELRWVKAFATKADGLSSISRHNAVELTFASCPLTYLHMDAMRHSTTATQNKCKNIKALEYSEGDDCHSLINSSSQRLGINKYQLY